jgi:enoyl-CoA hydratase/carnithine racemase
MRAVTVASVERCAVGAGLLLMGACDLRVVCDDARLLIPEAQLGLPLTWGGVPRLLRELGPALVRELIMTGRPLAPVEAQAMGFVNRVVAPEALDAETEALIGRLLETPTLPLRTTKAQVNQALRALLPVESDDAELGVAAISDPGFSETAMRYLQKMRSDT